MKKGVIVTNAFFVSSAPMFQAERIQYELQQLNCDVYIYKNNAYDSFTDKSGKAITTLAGLDFAVFLDKDKYLSRILENNGVRLFNTTSAIEVCDDKMLTHLALSGLNINMPITMPAPLCYNPSAELFKEDAEKIIEVLGLPLIVKSSFGSLGKEVFLIETKDELLKAMNNLKCTPHLYQQFVSSSFGRDVRIIVIGGKAFSAMMRKSYGDFRSNIDLGGEGHEYNPPDEFIEVAEKVACALGLDYCGVDLLFDKDNRPLLCEVNSNAFFKEMERVTKKNVAKAYAQHILQALNK